MQHKRIHFPASDGATPGRVWLEKKDDVTYHIRCTVKGCRFNAVRVYFEAAKGLADNHAGVHRVGGFR